MSTERLRPLLLAVGLLAAAPGLADETPPVAAPEAALAVAPATSGAPRPLGAEDDIYCSGFIGGDEEPVTARVTGSEYQALSPTLVAAGYKRGELAGIYGRDTVKFVLSVGDVVYLDGGRGAGLFPGQTLAAVEPRAAVRHPRTGASVGRFYRSLGRVRVLSVAEQSAIGEIVHTCGGIGVGAALVGFEPEPVPLARRSALRPVNDPAPAESLAEAPVILFAQDGLVSVGEDHVVYLDRGAADDVVPGDIFTVYRANRDGFPPVVIGEVAVLSVKQNSALGKVIASRFPIFVGDLLERK